MTRPDLAEMAAFRDALWPPGVPHRGIIEADSIVPTVRRPSLVPVLPT
jgi:hypothetical protein